MVVSQNTRPHLNKDEISEESEFLQKFKASKHKATKNEDEFIDYVNTWFNDNDKSK